MTTTTRAPQWMFESESMYEKPVTLVPGIGEVIAKQLAVLGVTTAEDLFGWWLIHRKDEKHFGKWLQKGVKCHKGTIRRIHEAFRDWSLYFL